ncbi:MAG: hypothetical protein RMH84_06610 [Sulfolobales archaeon]|nr:hypothetical protein [Sulfolobales archaeon]MCX8208887.1 hypothetical protein [Sulfolobales archaeon]MDW8011242.1 hypothetical protein [Sulfolobales archaeon]
MLKELLAVFLSILVYIALPIVLLLPITYAVKLYIRKVRLEKVLRELDYVALKLREISPSKKKRWRTIKAKYDSLYKSVRGLMWMNLLALWAGVLAMIYVTRHVAYLLEVSPPYSPLRLSWTPFTVVSIAVDDEWYVVDLFLYLAAIGVFNALHLRISGLRSLYEV